MGTTVASLAKLSRPRLHDAVPRERLFKLLDQARRHSVIWVGGPPGAGKTTLVGSWLEARRIPYRWYQIDSGDADPATFFSYLVELAGHGGAAPNLPYLTPEYLTDLSAFTRKFFQGFFARLPRCAVVVLDNAHEAAGDALNANLLEAAKQIPTGSTLIVVSRAQPPLALSRLSANKDIATVGWDDLRLTSDETTAIVRQAAVGAPPTPQDLHARTDGWAAGLILLLAYLRRGETERSLTSLGSRESVFAYFAGEVFERALPVQREVLMKIALLPQVTPAIARRLTDEASAPELLEQLYRFQYFTDRRTEPELSFRFHDLFREFLLARAESTWPAEDLDAHRTRAAMLLLECGQVEEAVTLLIAARQFARVADAIEARAGSLLAQGRWLTLQAWIDALPAALTDERPWLGYWLGTSHIPINQRTARRILARCYDLFLSRSDMRGQLLSACGIAEAICLMLDDVSDLDPWIPVLERLTLSERSSMNEGERFRVSSSLLTALFWRQSGHPRLADIKTEVRALVASGNDLRAQFSGGLQIAQVANLLGDWETAREIIDRNLPAIESGQCSAPMQAQWFAYVGYHHYVLARDALAWEYFRRSEQIALANGMEGTVTMVRSFWIYSAVACRDARVAGEVLARMQEARMSRAFDKAQYHMASARMAALSGERTAALAQARRAASAACETGSPMMMTFWHSVVAGILAEFGQFEESANHLQQARDIRRASGIAGYDAFLLMLEAFLSLEWRRDGRAPQLLRESLRMARERRNHYYFRTFVREIAGRMLEFALVHEIEADFAREVIRELHVQPAAACGPSWPWRIKVHTLGRLAIEVDGKPLTYGRKVPKKPLALLACLVSLGGEAVPEHRIADALWPDAEGDDARRRLALAVHRLRHLVGDSDAVRVQAGKLSLDRRRVWVDALFVLDSLAGAAAGGSDSSAAALLARGTFLECEPEESWMLTTRVRLERLRRGLDATPRESVNEKKELPA